MQQQVRVKVELSVFLVGLRHRVGARVAGAAAHIETGIAHRRQVTERHQAVVGFDSGKVADLMGLREFADRRQFAAGFQPVFFDRQADPRNDLVDQ